MFSTSLQVFFRMPSLSCSGNAFSVSLRHLVTFLSLSGQSISLRGFLRQLSQTCTCLPLGRIVMSRTLKITALFLGVASMLVFSALADRTNIRPAWNLFSTQQDVE